MRTDVTCAAAIAREVPVTLAGGLSPGQRRRGRAARDPRGRRGRRVRVGGTPGARGAPAQGPGEGRPVRQAARRPHATTGPTSPFGPTPVHPGLLEVDAAGRWGMERDFGGRYVPETLMAALVQLEAAYDAIRHDPVFWAELRDLLARFAGRPRRSTGRTGWPRPWSSRRIAGGRGRRRG